MWKMRIIRFIEHLKQLKKQHNKHLMIYIKRFLQAIFSNHYSMKTKISPLVQKEIINIQRKDKKLANRIEKQILLFEENPKHPSLRVHKLSGNRENMWSISIT